jgi:hypothetical protein
LGAVFMGLDGGMEWGSLIYGQSGSGDFICKEKGGGVYVESADLRGERRVKQEME